MNMHPEHTKQFSERPFTAGSLIGLRAFAVDELGRLVGPSHGQVFRPGENEAECKAEEGPTGAIRNLTAAVQRMNASMSYCTPLTMTWMVGGDPSLSSSFHPVQKFSSAYGAVGHELEKRAEAEAKAAREKERIEKLEREAEEKHRNHVVAAADCTCGFYAYVDGSNQYMETDFSYRNTLRVAAVIEGYGVCTVGNRGFRASKARLKALVLPLPDNPIEGQRLRLVERNYAGVDSFADTLAALSAYPLSNDHIPSPQTDDDFWTRSAS
jgi:hypothetical protein